MKKIAAGLAAIAGLVSALPASAVNLGDDINGNLAYGTATGLGTRDIRGVIMTIINVILGFLSIVAILIVLWGGFRWMTSGGDESQVSEAKKIIVAGVVGMAVIFSSYAVALFVARSLVNATT